MPSSKHSQSTLLMLFWVTCAGTAVGTLIATGVWTVLGHLAWH
jgi:hypothetical protein